ncbi:MAG: hypothetical protein V1906_01370 [Candidatus Woesearchaeota archaeon]
MAKGKTLNESIRLAESQVFNDEVTKAKTTMKDEDIDDLLMG